MINVTKDMIETLNELNESVKGTSDYAKYYMCVESKTKKSDRWSKWLYLGWCVPVIRDDYFIKKIHDTWYLMCQMNDDKMIRYTITDAIKSLWNIDKIKH
jgi:hypothetical protein